MATKAVKTSKQNQPVSNTPNLVPTNENIEYLWHLYENIGEWIRFSDAKAGALIAANGSILTIALSIADKVNFLLNRHQVYGAILFFGSISLFLSTFMAMKCILPRLGKLDMRYLPVRIYQGIRNRTLLKTVSMNGPSDLIYFGHIAKNYHNPENYEKAVFDNLLKPPGNISALSRQIWINSHIAARKYKDIVRSTWFLMFVLVFTSFTLLIAPIV